MQEKALGVHADNPHSTAQDQTSLLFSLTGIPCAIMAREKEKMPINGNKLDLSSNSQRDEENRT